MNISKTRKHKDTDNTKNRCICTGFSYVIIFYELLGCGFGIFGINLILDILHF